MGGNSEMSIVFINHKSQICLRGLYNLYSMQHLLSLDSCFRKGNTQKKNCFNREKVEEKPSRKSTAVKAWSSFVASRPLFSGLL